MNKSWSRHGSRKRRIGARVIELQVTILIRFPSHDYCGIVCFRISLFFLSMTPSGSRGFATTITSKVDLETFSGPESIVIDMDTRVNTSDGGHWCHGVACVTTAQARP